MMKHKILILILLQSFIPFANANKLINKLYKKRFRLNNEGIPIVTIGIETGLKKVVIFSRKGLNLRTGEQGKITFKGKTSLRIKLKNGKPAKTLYYAALESTPFNYKPDSVFLSKLKSYGANKKTRGFVIATGGKLLDTRRNFYVIGPFSRKAAYNKVNSLKKNFPNSFVYEELVSLPDGNFSIYPRNLNVSLDNLSAIEITPAGKDKLYIKINGTEVPYPGKLYVTIDKNGFLAVVNEISVETYLQGILPSEMFVSAPFEALKAQAVAARGQVLAKMGTRHLADPFFLCNKVHCQVYKGLKTFHSKTSSAVRATSGRFLFDAQGFPVDTVYHSVCGGHTENNRFVWGGKSLPYLKGVADFKRKNVGFSEARIKNYIKHPPESYCSIAKKAFRWKSLKTFAELRKSTSKYGIRGKINKIKVLKRGVSGRAIEISVTTTFKTYVIKGELNIRRAFGGLKSSLFTTTVSSIGILFEGAGYGHGVGMCQWGAIGRAKAGQKYKRILYKYYPHTKLIKLY